MSTIHFLNVKNGDCSIIQHNSGHVSVIDVCNASKGTAITEDFSLHDSAKSGNYHQKAYPTNPIAYLEQVVKTDSIFRYIQTHPDMDHMDGIKDLFESFSVINFWDTENTKDIPKGSDFGPYNKEDWEFYQVIRRGQKRLTVLNLYAGAEGQYYNQDSYGNPGGDELFILSPTKELIAEANESGNYNNASYCLLFKTSCFKVIFAGDTEEAAWDNILKKYKSMVTGIDLLIAPHHGRKTGGNDIYLDILKPKFTLFGNADSKDLDYSSWNNRSLLHVTNNQAGNIVINFSDSIMSVYCSNEYFAKDIYKQTSYNFKYHAYFIWALKKNDYTALN